MNCKSCHNQIPDGSIFCMYCGAQLIKPKAAKKPELKIPAPHKLPSGRWTIQLRREGQSATFDTAEECEAWAKAVRAGFIESEKNLPDISFRQAIDNYIESKNNILSPSTIRGYRVIQRNRFSEIMDKPISTCIDWQKECNKEAALCSPKTLKNSWYFMATILKKHGIDVPEITLPQIVQHTRPWLNPEQIKTFVAAVHNDPCEIPALLGLHSLRRSEICALTWENNIDLANRQIAVSGALVPDEHNDLIYKETNKTSSSRRYVPILINALYDALSAVENKSGYVVTCNPHTIRKQVNAVCERSNLPLVGAHGLRHSFASLAYHLNMPETEAMRLGGWSDRETMHKIYTHLSETDTQKYNSIMADFYAE